MEGWINRLLAQFFTALPELGELWAQTFRTVTITPTPLAFPTKPIAELRIALVTTGGVHGLYQPPFVMSDSRGDPSYRTIPANASPEQLMITHDYYDHTDAEHDLNILFPLERFRELVARGEVGALGTCYSFMGHIEPPHLHTLIHRTAPEVAGKLKQERVDAVLLTPA